MRDFAAAAGTGAPLRVLPVVRSRYARMRDTEWTSSASDRDLSQKTLDQESCQYCRDIREAPEAEDDVHQHSGTGKTLTSGLTVD